MNKETQKQIQKAFEEEVNRHRGTVMECGAFRGILFARAVVPQSKEIRPNDKLQGGVAMRGDSEGGLWVYPYVYRLVCKNGSVMARTRAAAEFVNPTWKSADEYLLALHEAVRACCMDHAFEESFQSIRPALEEVDDPMLNVLPWLAKLERKKGSKFADTVLAQYASEGERSLFGAMNAVTAVARDTKDPELRWDLEKIGGMVPMLAESRVEEREGEEAVTG